MVVVTKQPSRFGTDNTSHSSLLYQGEDYSSSKDLMYLRPRYYSPDTGQFNKVDPFSGNLEDPQSLHKYLYVHGDPVNNYDPTGEAIAALIANDVQQLNDATEYAHLARGAYKGRAHGLANWTTVRNGVFFNAQTGFRAVLFINRRSGNVVLSFSGTDDLPDGKNDVQQGAGLQTAQYDAAINLTRVLKQKYGGRLTLTGHSLGGGLATAAAIVNSVPAWAFNPASVHHNTVNRAGGNLRNARRWVNAFFVVGELLSISEGVTGATNAHYGKTYVVPGRPGVGALDRHGIDEVIRSFQAQITNLNSPSFRDRINNLNNTQNNRLLRQLYDEQGLYE